MPPVGHNHCGLRAALSSAACPAHPPFRLPRWRWGVAPPPPPPPGAAGPVAWLSGAQGSTRLRDVGAAGTGPTGSSISEAEVMTLCPVSPSPGVSQGSGQNTRLSRRCLAPPVPSQGPPGTPLPVPAALAASRSGGPSSLQGLCGQGTSGEKALLSPQARVRGHTCPGRAGDGLAGVFLVLVRHTLGTSLASWGEASPPPVAGRSHRSGRGRRGLAPGVSPCPWSGSSDLGWSGP